MQANPPAHPPSERLTAFVLGKLESAEVEAVESHLADCDSCCQTLKQIQEDTFIGLVRECREAPGPETALHHAEAGSAEAATVPPPDTVSPGAPELPAELADHPRYRIVRPLGTGGMGAVYQAEHRMMKRTVALKVINSQLVASKSAVERFQREVQAAARLHHPNIVTAYDAEQAGDAHFLVMEYVEGTDLHQVLQERGPLPVAQACDYVRQAALGLDHARENGMVHRDIKPHNLMLTPRGQVKILDFGLASLTSEPVEPGSVVTSITPALSSLTQTGSIMGTPDYMAPEQARDAHGADIRADIYSLGCTLFCLLTGRAPFPGGTPIDKIIAHSERRPPSARELRPGLPAGLAEVLNRMMAKRPKDRYQTPAEVAQALAPFSGGDAERSADVRKRIVTAPADALIVAASLAFLIGVGVHVVLWLAGTGVALANEKTLELMSASHLFYAFFMFGAGLLLRLLRRRMVALLGIVLFGIALPAILVVNVIMEWGRVPEWPIMIPQWLGVPVAVWAAVILFRQDVREAFAAEAARPRSGRRRLVGALTAVAIVLLLNGVIYITTDDGRVVIDSKVDDVQVVISKGGKEYEVIDAQSGTTVKRLPSGEYRVKLKGDRTDVKLDREGFKITRWGQEVVTVARTAKTKVGEFAGSRPGQSEAAVRPEEGWAPLFNGKDLAGWKTHPKQLKGWKVENGVIVGSGAKTSHLFTERGDFADFHLRAEVKINDHGNSGIYFRCGFGLPLLGSFPAGYEAQVLNGTYFYAPGKLEEQLTGSLYGLQRFKKRLALPEEWFELEVIARDNHLVIKLNGQTTADYVDPKRTYTRGHIALQLMAPPAGREPTVVQFRKIEVKELGKTK